MKRLLKYSIALILIMLCSNKVNVSATETTTPVEILYSNEYTELYAIPDITSQIFIDKDSFPDNVPVQVLGLEKSGFYKVELNGIYYIPVNGLVNKVLSREADVYNILISMKSQYPEGMPYTNNNFYAWNGGYYVGGYGCAAFAFALSDAAFGDTPAVIHKDYNNIRVGDILRINNDTHSVIVLEVKENSVIVAEGNYNSSIHWGREIKKDNIKDPFSYIMTRYE